MSQEYREGAYHVFQLFQDFWSRFQEQAVHINYFCPLAGQARGDMEHLANLLQAAYMGLSLAHRMTADGDQVVVLNNIRPAYMLTSAKEALKIIGYNSLLVLFACLSVCLSVQCSGSHMYVCLFTGITSRTLLSVAPLAT